MAIHSKSDHGVMSEINVTPLVDVMLVLLVVFLVTAPLLVQSIPVELPKTAPAAPIPDLHHTDLTINADGKIFLDGKAVEMAALETELKALAQSAHPPQVLIQADHSLPYGTVAQLLAMVQHTGIRQLSMVTQEQ
jgi:biopolymer transport protein ExbD